MPNPAYKELNPGLEARMAGHGHVLARNRLSYQQSHVMMLKDANLVALYKEMMIDVQLAVQPW